MLILGTSQADHPQKKILTRCQKLGILQLADTVSERSVAAGPLKKRHTGGILMNIVVLKSSPNPHESSNLLADRFILGAEAAGHTVTVIDAARADIHPCMGCVRCGYEGPCVQRDGMEEIKGVILSSDMLVFVTPLYYYGMTAQLKTLIDRFCAFNSSLTGRQLKSALITAAWNSDEWTFEALEAHYKTLVRYLHFRDQGMILGYGCGTVEMTKTSGFPERAYELGKSLK